MSVGHRNNNESMLRWGRQWNIRESHFPIATGSLVASNVLLRVLFLARARSEVGAPGPPVWDATCWSEVARNDARRFWRDFWIWNVDSNFELLWRVPIYFFSNFELFPRDVYWLFSLVWIVASVFVIAIWNLNLHSVYVFYLLILLHKEIITNLPKKHYYSILIFAVAIIKTFI